MKKILVVSLAAVMAMAVFVGCGKEESVEPTPTPEPTKETRYAPYFTAEPFEASGVVWIAGDSIASEHDDNEYEVPIAGWGEYLGDYLNKEAIVHNEARSGRSSKSYIKETNYKELRRNLAYGDYLLISFGLNDEKSDIPKLYTTAEGDSTTDGSFANYLAEYYIEPALEVGAEPVLLSPVVRATYEAGELTEQTQVPYVEAMESLVKEYEEKGITLYYIDLYEITEEWYEELGYEGVREIHGIDHEGKDDTTHFSEEGAKLLAEKIVEQIETQQMELSVFIK